MSTPWNTSLMEKEFFRIHTKELAGYNITLNHGIPFPDAFAQSVKAHRIPGQEASSSHTQAGIYTRSAAAMDHENTRCRMLDNYLLLHGERYAGDTPGLTLEDQVNSNKHYLPSSP
ncbi:hypothetical protein AA0117_g12272 [Alternaria alternata]|uniref:Uncharacterized protein n=1 Tax=Alternaria alternata TaxID=5599 RepID=A0A4Q4N0W0_ALTAL|nr:hypothetical protein AA0117_g12272 [Alternaria alternata]